MTVVRGMFADVPTGPGITAAGTEFSAPVPVRLTVWVLPDTPPALSVIVSVPVVVPLAVGVKVTLIVQLPSALKLTPKQLSVSKKTKEPAVTATLEILSVALPVLAKVTDCEALEVPTSMVPKVRLFAESKTLGLEPVPVKPTVCWLPDTPPELSAMVSVPVRVPLALGEKTTLMVQLPPTLTLLAQIVGSEKSPLVEILAIERAADPVLLRVTGWEALEVPTAWLLKVRLEGETEARGATPVPLKLTVCGLPLALSVRVIVPVRVPLAVGVKNTLIAQPVPAATLAPQLSCWEKSPVTAMLRVSVAVPRLLTWTN